MMMFFHSTVDKKSDSAHETSQSIEKDPNVSKVRRIVASVSKLLPSKGIL